MNRRRDVLRFRVELRDIEPVIWRRLWVPARYSFWDLHVAIQDAFGWLDCHLHEFHVSTGFDEPAIFGIPDDEGWDTERQVLPGWEHPVAEYLREPGTVTRYNYDFGDDWNHDVTLEAIAPRTPGTKYPCCIDGARACPPEDCGGPPGYFELIQALRDRTHPEHEDLKRWLGPGWEPERFDPRRVRFDNPKRRWRHAFES